MTQALDMDFTKPTMNKEKKKRLKPRCDTYDVRTSYDANVNLAENCRKLVAETVPSAVLLHLLPDPDTCNSQHHQLDPENINDRSPSCEQLLSHRLPRIRPADCLCIR